MDKISSNSIKNRTIAKLPIGIIILGAVLFLLAWAFYYWQAWTYLVIISLYEIITTIYFLRYNSKLIERRFNEGPTAEKYKSQKIIAFFIYLFTIIVFILSILDHRFNWSYVPYYLTIIADVIICIALILLFFVFKENTYLSATIGVEGQQKVIPTGPYKIVRHPMYAEALLFIIFTPLALGSLWGLCAGFSLVPIIIWRLTDEEKLLSKKLPGYKEYCKKTCYRLIPLIW